MSPFDMAGAVDLVSGSDDDMAFISEPLQLPPPQRGVLKEGARDGLPSLCAAPISLSICTPPSPKMLSLGSWKFTAPQTSLPAYELPPMATLYAAGAWPAVGQTDPAADAVVDAILAEIGLDHGALPQCLHANEKKRPSQSPLRPAASFRLTGANATLPATCTDLLTFPSLAGTEYLFAGPPPASRPAVNSYGRPHPPAFPFGTSTPRSFLNDIAPVKLIPCPGAIAPLFNVPSLPASGPASGATSGASGAPSASAGASYSAATGTEGHTSGDDMVSDDGEVCTEDAVTAAQLEREGYFDMPIKAAAERLRVGVTTLKKACRTAGITRWPFRHRFSMKKTLRKAEVYLQGADEASRAAALQTLARGSQDKAADEEIKRIRQSIFKLEYKKRHSGRRGKA